MRDSALSSPDVHGRGEIFSHLIYFGRALKERGFQITPGRLIHAARSVELIDISCREDFSAALKTNFVSRKAELPLFDELFSQFWSRMKKMQRPSPQAGTEESESEGGSTNEAPSLSLDSGPSPSKDEGEEKERKGEYSPHEVLMAKDFSQFLAEEKEVLDREFARLLSRIAVRISRRREPSAKGREMDFRRCIRKSMSTGGEILKLIRRRRKVKPLRLIVICDVSGSMDPSTRFTLQFIFGLREVFRRSEFFVFSTRLTRVTDIIKRNRRAESLAAISRRVQDWSGGTQIGACLHYFNERYGRDLMVDPAIAILVSDGWDRGDAQLLDSEMKRLRRKARKLIWLNPLLGTPEYQPLCQGMRTALPYIDYFIPASTLKGLHGLGEALVELSN